MAEDSPTSTLAAVLLALPQGIWWKVYQSDPDENGLAKGTGRPIVEINALLVSVGPCKDTPSRGIHWSKKPRGTWGRGRLVDKSAYTLVMLAYTVSLALCTP